MVLDWREEVEEGGVEGWHACIEGEGKWRNSMVYIIYIYYNFANGALNSLLCHVVVFTVKKSYQTSVVGALILLRNTGESFL